MQFNEKLDWAIKAAEHWDEMRIDQRQSDAQALGWDESVGKRKWSELTKEQQETYLDHYIKEN